MPAFADLLSKIRLNRVLGQPDPGIAPPPFNPSAPMPNIPPPGGAPIMHNTTVSDAPPIMHNTTIQDVLPKPVMHNTTIQDVPPEYMMNTTVTDMEPPPIMHRTEITDVPPGGENMARGQFPMNNRLQQLLGSFPQRTKPSFLRKLGASVVAAGPGTAAAERFMNRDYLDKVADWKTQADVYGDMARSESALARADIAQGTLDERIRSNQANEAIRRDRARVYEYKAMNPNSKFEMDRQGNLIAIDPVTNKATPIVDEMGVPIQSGRLPEIDRIMLGIEGRLRVTEAAGAQARQTEGVRQRGREILAGMKQTYAIDMERYKQTGRVEIKQMGGGGSDSASLESQSQLQKRFFNNAQLAIQRNPALEEWIEFDSDTGFPQVKPVEEMQGGKLYNMTGFGSPPKSKAGLEKKRQEVMDLIFGSGTAQVTRASVARDRVLPSAEARPSASTTGGTLYDQAKAYVAANPTMKQWIDIRDADKSVAITPPGEGGPTPEEYQAMQQGILGIIADRTGLDSLGASAPGMSNRPTGPTIRTPTPAPAPRIPPPAPAGGKVFVRNKRTGQVGKMLPSELSKYPDWEQVQ